MTEERKAWLEKRKNGIGGSEASAVIGCNPYMTNVELWEIKTGRREQPDISEKACVKYGTMAEAPLIELFALDFPKYEVKHVDYDLRMHPDIPFLFVSLDGALLDGNGRRGVLEVKTTNILQSMQAEKWNDRVPQNYFVQVLHSLLVTGYDFAVLKAQMKTEWNGEIQLKTRHYHFERQDFEADIQFLLDREIVFWDHVKKDVCPPLVLPQI
ncbi:MAG: YqaJ viral recombinase family protein [Lactobacillales bacterium]|jgi:putative phage-type endonuclease|nr:YqaJ viral recombinase family protein [Lactobacillales bacterium]